MVSIRVGLDLGLGMAVTPHAKSLIDLKDRVEVAYAFSPSRRATQSSRERFAFPQCERLETILDDRSVDAVLILTPPNTHLELASASPRPGSTSCSRSRSRSRPRAREQLVQRCDASVTLGVVLQHRFRPAAEKLHEIASGIARQAGLGVGPIPNWRPQSYYDQPGRGTRARDGGGVLLTQGIHTLDLLSVVRRRSVGGEELRRPPRRCTAWKPKTWFARRCGSRAARSVSLHATTAAYPGLSRAHRADRHERHGASGRHGARASQLMDGRAFELKTDAGGGGTGADPMAFPHDWHRGVLADFLDAIEKHRPPRVERRRGAQGSPLHRHAAADAAICRLTSSRRVH